MLQGAKFFPRLFAGIAGAVRFPNRTASVSSGEGCAASCGFLGFTSTRLEQSANWYGRSTGEKVAIKLLERGPDKVTKHVERELRSHISFCHPHVVRFKNLFLTDTHLAVVLEYVEGGDLFQYCR